MPDEKIDRKRPADAENEPKPIQQRHVDDTVDDSFPASDPPAWTTSASKSVAAECEPDDLNDMPVPPGRGVKGGAGRDSQSRYRQASDLAQDLYRRGQSYMEQGRQYLPEAERLYRHGARAVKQPVQEHPLATILAVGALGCAVGWLLGRRTAETGTSRQWHVGSNQRPRETHTWRPTPQAIRRSGYRPASGAAEVASHTNNSF